MSSTAVLLLLTGLERARRTAARAAEIHRRFERSAAALDAALGRSAAAPQRLVKHQAQMKALRELVASAAASFDRATAIAEARLHGMWIDAASGARPSHRAPEPRAPARV